MQLQSYITGHLLRPKEELTLCSISGNAQQLCKPDQNDFDEHIWKDNGITQWSRPVLKHGGAQESQLV